MGILTGIFKSRDKRMCFSNDAYESFHNPDQAEIVKQIFAETLSGRGSQAIANSLNQGRSAFLQSLSQGPHTLS